MLNTISLLTFVAFLSAVTTACKKDKDNPGPATPPVTEQDLQGNWVAYTTWSDFDSTSLNADFQFNILMHVEGSTMLLDTPAIENLSCREPRDFKVNGSTLELAASEHCPAAQFGVMKVQGSPNIVLTIEGQSHTVAPTRDDFMYSIVSNAYQKAEDVPAPIAAFFVASQDNEAIDSSVKEAETWLRTLTFQIKGPIPSGRSFDIADGRFINPEYSAKVRCNIMGVPQLKEDASYTSPVSSIEWHLPRRESNMWKLEASLSGQAKAQTSTDRIFANAIIFLAADGKANLMCIKPITEAPWTMAELKAILVPTVFAD